MPVIYIDSVFLLNTVTDYFLLLITARLAGISMKRVKYLAASVLGGAYAMAVFLPGGAFLAAPAVKVCAGILMALIAFGNERRLFRLTLLLFAVSCAFAGGVLGLGLLLGEIPLMGGILYTNVNTKVLAAAFGAGYLLVVLVFHASAQHKVAGTLIPVQINHQGKCAKMTALWDTGNRLKNPISGDSILLVSPDQLYGLIPNCVRRILEQELHRPMLAMEKISLLEPYLCPQLVPYHAVGTSSGLLLSIRLDSAKIGGIRHRGIRVALSPTEFGHEYAALWGGEIGGGEHGRVKKGAVPTLDAAV